MSLSPQYVGDGIYIQVDQEDPTRLILTTRSHILEDADNVIYLERREAAFIHLFLNDFLGK